MAKAPAFRTGVDIIEETGKAAGRRFQRDNFFSLDDGDETIIRFITEADPRPILDDKGKPKLDEDGDPMIELGWITVDQYGFLPTKDQPKNYQGKTWPKSMPAVSRSDPAFAWMFEDDYVAEHMRDSKGNAYRPSQRYWALACIREEVREGGRVVGYKDKTREVEVPGKDGAESKTITEKDIVIVNMAYSNFFSILTGFVKQYGTALDRDYHIRRKGSGPNDTEYKITPLDRIAVADNKPGFEGADGRRYYDLRDPEIAARYEYATPLWEIVLQRASDEYYERFFDKRVTIDDGKDDDEKGGKGAPSSQQVKPVDDPDEDRMAALKNRVMGYDDAATEGDAPADDAAEPEKVPASSGGLRNFDDD
jgi:hypothetical protein